jgi:hypothetical protein
MKWRAAAAALVFWAFAIGAIMTIVYPVAREQIPASGLVAIFRYVGCSEYVQIASASKNIDKMPRLNISDFGGV